jgi:hypothetical protein
MSFMHEHCCFFGRFCIFENVTRSDLSLNSICVISLSSNYTRSFLCSGYTLPCISLTDLFWTQYRRSLLSFNLVSRPRVPNVMWADTSLFRRGHQRNHKVTTTYYWRREASPWQMTKEKKEFRITHALPERFASSFCLQQSCVRQGSPIRELQSAEKFARVCIMSTLLCSHIALAWCVIHAQ